MSIVYSIFASEFCNTNVSWVILCTNLFCKMIYMALILLFFVTVFVIKNQTTKGYKCDACLNIYTIYFTWRRNIPTSCLKKANLRG